jgi:hypothetical protein
MGPSNLVKKDEGLYSHELNFTDPSGQPIDQMHWSDHATEWNRGFHYKDKLVLFGVVGSSAQTITILDTTTKKSLLFVLCRTPSVSPSGRYIGYLQFKPRVVVGDTLDDIVLLLDLDNLPAMESSRNGWVIDSTNLGTAVYPREYIGEKQFYVPARQAGPSPNLIPVPAAWDSKHDVFAVVSKISGQWFLVSVDLTAGVAQRNLRERSLDIRQFLKEDGDNPVIVEQVQKELMINRLDVGDGVASISAAQISNIKLGDVVMPLR